MNQEITTHRIGGLELVLLVSNTMTIMAGATIAPSLPEMSRVFQATPNSEVLCKLVLTVPSLIYCYRCPIIGVLLDRWGRKPVLEEHPDKKTNSIQISINQIKEIS